MQDQTDMVVNNHLYITGAFGIADFLESVILH